MYCLKKHRLILCFLSLSAQSWETPASGSNQSPNPNNPAEYCSTIPPLQQAQASGVLSSPPPTVMVPVGVLKQAGNEGTTFTKNKNSLLFIFTLVVFFLVTKSLLAYSFHSCNFVVFRVPDTGAEEGVVRWRRATKRRHSRVPQTSDLQPGALAVTGNLKQILHSWILRGRLGMTNIHPQLMLLGERVMVILCS